MVAFTQYKGASTAYEVELHPIPDTSSETITYEYYKSIADWSDSNDATELSAFFPTAVQTTIIHDATAYYQSEKGDDESAVLSRSRHENSRRALLGMNGQMSGDHITRTRRRDRPVITNDPFQPAEGSLS